MTLNDRKEKLLNIEGAHDGKAASSSAMRRTIITDFLSGNTEEKKPAFSCHMLDMQ